MSLQSARRAGGAISLGLAVVATSAMPGSASTPSPEVDDLVRAVEEATPAPFEIEALEQGGRGFIAGEASGSEVTFDPDRLQASLDVGLGSLEPSIVLPQELQKGAEVHSSNGSVVVVGEGAAATVRSGAGQLQIATTTHSAEGPHRFTYEVPGATLESQTDGSVHVTYELDEYTLTSGSIEQPWAYDAKGEQVATWYEVEGSLLTQVIEPDSQTTYPVIADPTWSGGWGLYAHFNRAETASIPGASTNWIIALCAAGGSVGGAPGAAIMGSACGAAVAAIKWQASVANNSSPKRCLFIRFVPLGVATSAHPGTYNDSRCR